MATIDSLLARRAGHALAKGLGLCLAAAVIAPLSGCGEKEQADYGSVRIDIKLKNAEENPLSQTKTVVIVGFYNDCVSDFYRKKGANLVFDSPKGEKIVEEWKQRICAKNDSSDFGGTVGKFFECDADDIEITQSVGEEQDQPSIKIRIPISSRDKAEELLTHDIRVGPLPTPELTGCKTWLAFDTGRSLQGLGKNGTVVWTTLSDNPGKSEPTPTSNFAYEATIGVLGD